VEENPYASPCNESPEPAGPGLLGQLFEVRHWRLGVMVCLIASALVTPADPYSLFLVAIPLIAVYFLIVALRARLIRRSAARATLTHPGESSRPH